MMGTWTEGLVGVSLIAIGLLGLKESLLDYHGPTHESEASDATVQRSVGAAGYSPGAGVARETGGGRAIFLNGILHGFSWDGAPSLAPALALSSWSSVLWFLLAYCSGTMVSAELVICGLSWGVTVVWAGILIGLFYLSLLSVFLTRYWPVDKHILNRMRLKTS